MIVALLPYIRAINAARQSGDDTMARRGLAIFIKQQETNNMKRALTDKAVAGRA